MSGWGESDGGASTVVRSGSSRAFRPSGPAFAGAAFDGVCRAAVRLTGCSAARVVEADAVRGLLLDDVVLVVDEASGDPGSDRVRVLVGTAVGAWAGVPLPTRDGQPVAVLLVVDGRARSWTEEQVGVLTELAALAATEWSLRVDLGELRAREAISERRSHRSEDDVAALELRALASEARAVDLERREQASSQEVRDTRRWAHESVRAAREESERAGALAAVARRQASAAVELAETLQQSLVPMHPPRVPGMEIAARHATPSDGEGLAGEVLGDFYDVFATPTGWGFVVGDVCGHGPEAARTTALARSTVRALGHSESDPVTVLTALNGVLRDWFGRDRSFVTAVYGVVTASDDPDHPGMSVRIASAGHPAGFVHHSAPVAAGSPQRVDELEAGGRVLGLVDAAVVASQTVHLAPASALVLTTDGVLEARAANDPRQFGEDGMRAALEGLPPMSSADRIADTVLAAADTFAHGRSGDDSLVLVVRTPSA